MTRYRESPEVRKHRRRQERSLIRKRRQAEAEAEARGEWQKFLDNLNQIERLIIRVTGRPKVWLPVLAVTGLVLGVGLLAAALAVLKLALWIITALAYHYLGS